MTPSDAGPWHTLECGYGAALVVHVYPGFGPTHYATLSCWCHPELEPETETHHALVHHNVAQ